MAQEGAREFQRLSVTNLTVILAEIKSMSISTVPNFLVINITIVIITMRIINLSLVFT